jgi:hypothetical protein
MSHPNSADRTYAALFAGAQPQGDLTQSYFALVLQLVASRDAAETLNGPDEIMRQVFALVGPESLAAVDVAKRLNTYREKIAKGNA